MLLLSNNLKLKKDVYNLKQNKSKKILLEFEFSKIYSNEEIGDNKNEIIINFSAFCSK